MSLLLWPLRIDRVSIYVLDGLPHKKSELLTSKKWGYTNVKTFTFYLKHLNNETFYRYFHNSEYNFFNKLQILDIGANLTDAMYEGVYNGSKKHEPDLMHVLKRSWQTGLQKVIITGGSLSESEKSLELAKTDGKII